MQDGFLALGGAKQAAGAAVIGFALFPNRCRAADRALARHAELRRLRHALFRQHADHLGNHVARTPHDDRVAHAHILAPRLVLVVQRGVGHGHAADEHRCQLGHRRQLAGAPDLDVDAKYGRQLLLRRVFVRHRPARLTRFKTQLALQAQAVDLVNHAINVKGQLVPLLPDALVKRYQFRSTQHRLRLHCDRKTP